CWAPNADYFEWLLYAPILLSLLVNVFFMVRIVHIMVNQLEPHPNEPSTF
ncbi:calcitonin gene-related peptide type 1 receptor, partial [Biomphalaria pfeifferi]